jgi:hypothetical protein
MKLIETKTLGTAAASIEFTSIPQTFTDLVVFLSLRNQTSTSYAAVLKFNSSTSGYSNIRLYGNGTSVTSDSTSGVGILNVLGVSSTDTTANTFGNTELYVPNYSGIKVKTLSANSTSENNSSTAFTAIVSGLWNDTSSITSVSFTPPAGNFVAGSTISLYGITKGSDGITTAS